MSGNFDAIQISIGLESSSGEGLPSLWLHDEGLHIGGAVTQEDMMVMVAVLRDAADAVEVLLHGQTIGSSEKH